MFVADAEAARRDARALRPVVAALRDPRRRAVSGRGEAGDVRLVGPDRLRVLRRHRDQRAHVHPARRVARAPGLGRARDPRRASTSSTTTVATCPRASRAPSTSPTGWSSSTTTIPTRPPAAYDGSGRSTIGDIGYVDDEGYLYLTDRKAFMIISGGVNIYPQEAENVAGHAPEGGRRRGVRGARRRHGRSRQGRRAARGRRRAVAGGRGRAPRVLPRRSSRRTSARGRSTSRPSCPASRPASSTSAPSATATGPATRRASCDHSIVLASVDLV